MDTRVPLLDGRILSISDIEKEMNEGKKNWAYSCNPDTGEMVPGLITWAGVTQKSTKVMKLTLDNNEEIICTPEHKFPIKGKGKIEAKDIIINEDSIYSFNTQEEDKSDFKKKAHAHNHCVVKAEYLDNSMEVGTLTIDGDEQYHNYHTFAIEQGVYTYNSNVTDAAYNPLCLALDTEIPLLDGRVLPLQTLIDEYDTGKENWVYSCDPVTGKVVPGNISWAGVTKKDAKVIKLTLDNDETVILTPEHKIPVLGKGFVEAKDLTVNDSLISYETQYKSLTRKQADKDRTYQQVYNHEINKWEFTHRVVGEFFKDLGKHQILHFSEKLIKEDKNTVHHKNYNRLNNDPRNLQWMNAIDHRLYHSFNKKEYWENISEEESKRVKDKIRSSLKAYWDNMSDEDYAKFCKECSVRNSKILRNMKQNKDENQNLNITHELLTRLVEIVKEHNSDRLQTIELCNRDDKLLKILKDTNPIDPKSITDSKLTRIYKKFGYDNWKDFKKKTEVFNHRIKTMEYLDETQDVGTLTIDLEEKWHNYHTFALKSGIFVKNSSLEDYFFAQTSEGRGSKVETLPGGDNLGDINDMLYFNNKMFRALGVPSSYLPTGADDGTSASSDGRVGTAFIQEYRFTEKCKRHQRQIVEKLDDEFKLFLKFKGITIDNASFNISFTPPQNFSEYRQIELDAARSNVFSSFVDIPFISKRFAMKKWGGFSEEEIHENERMWREEQDADDLTDSSDEDQAGLGQVGISSSDMTSDSVDIDNGEEDIDTEDDFGDVSDDELDSFGEE